MSTSPTKLVEDMLTKSTPNFEVLEIHQFSSEYEAHDDRLQEELAVRFGRSFELAFQELRATFGEPSVLDAPSQELHMTSFRSAVWYHEEKAISLMAGHEDRECPFVILLGVTAKKQN